MCTMASPDVRGSQLGKNDLGTVKRNRWERSGWDVVGGKKMVRVKVGLLVSGIAFFRKCDAAYIEDC